MRQPASGSPNPIRLGAIWASCDSGDSNAPVPIASALVARGKCRSCGARIDPLHWKFELAAAVIGGGSLAIAPDARGAALALFCWLLLPSTILDWRYYWLPNRLTATLAVAGLVAGGFLSGVPLFHRLIGGATGFGALALVAEAYRRVRSREGLGRGDAKLLGAIGLWTGWAVLPAILLAASAIGLAGAAIRQRGPGHAVAFGSLLAVAAAVTGAVMVVFPELLRTG